MTKENKELLLKDLCARLPYGVILTNGAKVRSIDVLTKIVSGIGTDKKIEDTKYYLRPMSSMTEEEKKVVNNLIYNRECIWTSPVPIWVINESDIEEYIDFCNLHHLDWRGLIPKGLALEAPEEMYKKEE